MKLRMQRYERDLFGMSAQYGRSLRSPSRFAHYNNSTKILSLLFRSCFAIVSDAITPFADTTLMPCRISTTLRRYVAEESVRLGAEVQYGRILRSSAHFTHYNNGRKILGSFLTSYSHRTHTLDAITCPIAQQHGVALSPHVRSSRPSRKSSLYILT